MYDLDICRSLLKRFWFPYKYNNYRIDAEYTAQESYELQQQQKD